MHTRTRLPQRVFCSVGVGAAIAMCWIAAVTDSDSHAIAGSGDAPTGSTYQQPSVAPMNLGATATWTPPDRQEPTMKGVPSIHAHP